MVFLQKKLYFFLTLAVITTTLTPLLNLNSILIIAIVICRLFDGKPRQNIGNAIHDRYFLTWIAIFLLEFAGLFYTHHFFTAWKYVESKATLIAIPFLICSGPFADENTRDKLFASICVILTLLSSWCLLLAGIEYLHTADHFVFFYHHLTRPLEQNAVFFSAYIICALTWLLAKRKRSIMIPFFTGMIILLDSKLAILFTFSVIAIYLLPRIQRKWLIPLSTSLLLLISILAFTTNPIQIRYRQILPPYTVYNGVTLRALIWRSAPAILDEHKAWVAGVTAGESQRYLDEKLTAAGCANFRSYNFHNEFIEIGVRSGAIGLTVFLLFCAIMIGLARKTATKEAWLTVILFLLLALTESMLEMQQAAFFSCFFILLHHRNARHETLVV